MFCISHRRGIKDDRKLIVNFVLLFKNLTSVSKHYKQADKCHHYLLLLSQSSYQLEFHFLKFWLCICKSKLVATSNLNWSFQLSALILNYSSLHELFEIWLSNLKILLRRKESWTIVNLKRQRWKKYWIYEIENIIQPCHSGDSHVCSTFDFLHNSHFQGISYKK